MATVFIFISHVKQPYLFNFIAQCSWTVVFVVASLYRRLPAFFAYIWWLLAHLIVPLRVLQGQLAAKFVVVRSDGFLPLAVFLWIFPCTTNMTILLSRILYAKYFIFLFLMSSSRTFPSSPILAKTIWNVVFPMKIFSSLR